MVPPPLMHPGSYLKESVLRPRKLTVSAAAKLIGIGRPALSNFVNGHVSTTAAMASRIEVAFNIPARKLLEMQTAYDAAQVTVRGAPTNALPYVAPFLAIKATDIEAWAERNIAARVRLSVFLRTLVNSTVIGATRVDFPGNDDAERPGWDGFVESERSSPWVPQGISGWEFGTNRDVKSKADADFDKSVKATPKGERDDTTFVFVTPRHWPSKANWVAARNATGLWKAVRAYDSSDIEQWLEQSIAAQAWFSNETSRVSDGVRSLDKCWDDWANVTSRPLVGSLFAPAIAVALRTIGSRLSRPPGEPISIAADSAEEALAFLAQLFGPAGGPELQSYRDRVLVFGEPGVLPKLAQGTGGFIAVTANRSVERELGPFAQSLHSILIYPRNAANVSPLVVLEPLSHEAFRSSLEEMEFGRDDVARYSNESGRSLTVLRRRLATHPAIRTPTWAGSHETARSLIAFLFAGAWSSTNPADQIALALLADVDSYDSLEAECQRLANLDDAPVWSVGTARGVVSKIDLLFAVAGAVTAPDLERFFEMAKIVLGEDDPKLDLPESDRWAAAIYGKSRELSGSLRGGMAETLVLLAVYGNERFQSRIGFDCEAAATRVVRSLLSPLNGRILEANDRDLTAYAEAAPDAFLSILEDDLATEHPEAFCVMRPVGSGFFGTCPRTGLLWALESLAWSPRTLPQSALILARLAEIEINDNWVNKPIRSLGMIFDARMPQTAADHGARLDALKLLAERFPTVTWSICVGQLKTDHWIGHYSHKPRWRNEASGFGEPFKTWDPVLAFMRALVEMVLNWKGGYSREMVRDLIGCLYNLSEEYRSTVWELLRSWSDSGASDSDKAFVREEIRRTVLSRHASRRSKDVGMATLAAEARSAYDSLVPTDLLNRHEWLFREQWVEASMGELQDESLDFHEREERVAELRIEALRQIQAARGLPGIVALATQGKAASTIGWLVATRLLPNDELLQFVLAALCATSEQDRAARSDLISGALRGLQSENACAKFLERAREHLSEAEFADLLLLAPFRRSTWSLVDGLDEPLRHAFWTAVSPEWIRDSPDETREAVERLLGARRPRAAFACVRLQINEVDPELVFRVLSEIPKGGDEKSGYYHLDSHDVEQAFIHIDKNAGPSLDEKAVLEFAYLDALANSMGPRGRYGIPNLEKYIEIHPELFVQAVVWAYKRRGEGDDPPGLKAAPENEQHFAERGHKLLTALSRIPGRDELGDLRAENLAEWVRAVRTGCDEVGRLEVGDICIGDLLSSAPAGKDGVWPCEPVRDVLEAVRSRDVMSGMATGRYNSRGLTWRGEGGDQERALAGQYSAWADVLRFSHPFVASELLSSMVTTFEREAAGEDTEAQVRKRLG